MAGQANESGHQNDTKAESGAVVKSEGMNENNDLSSDKMEKNKKMKDKKENSKEKVIASNRNAKSGTPFCFLYILFCFFLHSFFFLV